MMGTVMLPSYEVERLRRLVTGAERSGAAFDADLDGEQSGRFEELVARRCGGHPLQYLEGTLPFGPIEVIVDRRALIPRPETEQLWETAVQSLGDAGPGTPIVDLGTGSGVLALALKQAFPDAPVYATDVSEPALSLAAENAVHTGLEIELLAGDLFEALPRSLLGRIEMIVSNPPYVSEAEWGSLPVEIRDHEPHRALVAGPEGIEALARIAEEAFWWLGVGGWVICEIGETQRRAVLDLFAAYDREVRRDLAGRDRFLVARKGMSCCR